MTTEDGQMTRIERMMAAPRPWLTGGGTETAMIFHEGFDLPEFAAFTLVDRPEGRAALTRMAMGGIGAATAAGTGYVLDAETWRANAAWGAVMGLDQDEIRRINHAAVAFAADIRMSAERRDLPILLCGSVGPLGDGYEASRAPTADSAYDAHSVQMGALAAAGADLAGAMTMTSSAEAIGVTRAAEAAWLPTVISFTVETDGRLPSGEALGDAVRAVDDATGGAPLFFGINCAHPDHFRDALDAGAPWLDRIGLLRPNASRLSHAELDAMEVLDEGDPHEFGRLLADLAAALPALRIVGGCCGSDHRHVGCTARALNQRHRTMAA